MRSVMVLAALVMLVAGCATGPKGPEQISFDRASFALTYGKVSQAVTMKCEAKQLTDAECSALAEIDRSITRSILTPPATAPASVDMEALMRLLMVAAKFAM